MREISVIPWPPRYTLTHVQSTLALPRRALGDLAAEFRPGQWKDGDPSFGNAALVERGRGGWPQMTWRSPRYLKSLPLTQ
jgi:hypothetical protein